MSKEEVAEFANSYIKVREDLFRSKLARALMYTEDRLEFDDFNIDWIILEGEKFCNQAMNDPEKVGRVLWKASWDLNVYNSCTSLKEILNLLGRKMGKKLPSAAMTKRWKKLKIVDDDEFDDADVKYEQFRKEFPRLLESGKFIRREL